MSLIIHDFLEISSIELKIATETKLEMGMTEMKLFRIVGLTMMIQRHQKLKNWKKNINDNINYIVNCILLHDHTLAPLT